VPGLWWGSNGDIAWSITNNAASTRDLYREEVHPSNPNLYRDGDSWRPFDERIIEVQVRGQAPVRHVQRSTVRGPIVNHVVPAVAEGGDPPLALRWVGQEHLDDIRAAIAIGRAHDWPSFRDALRDWSVAVFNFVYADRQGHIGYQCAGRVPLRGRVTGGYRDAGEPADAWQGYIPFDDLPRQEDPERGYVASANQRVAPDDFPQPLHGAWGSGHRGERIREVFESTPRMDRQQAVALQNDVTSARAERLCPPLVRWLAEADDPDAMLVRTTLAAWDARYATESIAPTLFETLMQTWQERVARARFPQRLVDLVQGHNGAAARLIERGEPADWFAADLRAEIVAAARETVARVRQRYGSDPAAWQWGRVHHAHWRHPISAPDRAGLDIGPAPVDGGSDTLRNTGAGQPPFAASSGAEYRMVVDFAEPDRFLAVQNIGNSGQPGTPHYADQFDDWLAGRYHVVHLERAAVERDAEDTLLLEPSGEAS
jgi:penicillin amidase